MATPAPLCVGVYRREVSGGIALAWDNVLDWEHLPWLHRESFRSIEKRDAGAWGWRARVGLAPRGEIDLELLVERDAGRYVARTTAGPGAGSEIWTRLVERGPGRTGVEVEFHVPGLRPEQADAVGRAYVALYTRLWDEDAAMIERRAGLLGACTPDGAELRLGPLAALRARLPFDLALGGRPVRVLELDGQLTAYATACPHQLGPLAPGDAPGELVCPWHGYRFDLRTRRSCDGRGLRLAPGPELALEGPEREVVLRWR